MTTPPTGTVTFLFTDIEGSTQRWERHRGAMQAALLRHNAILDRATAAHRGHVFKTVGDAYCVAFAHAADALQAAIGAQRALQLERWEEVSPGFEPLLVRMAIHTGLVELKDGDYFGRPVNRVARLIAAAHGGQVLLSLATEQLVRDALPDGARLVDLGMHRLKDLEHTEHLFRLVAPGVPDIDTPPNTAEALPSVARPHSDLDSLPTDCPYRGLFAFREEDAPFFFGREAFSNRLSSAVGGQRMVGVIGASGSGKSSIVFAGLVPRLRKSDGHDLPWLVLEMRPTAKPFHALAAEVVPHLEPGMTEADRLIETGKVARALTTGELDLTSVLGRIRDKVAQTSSPPQFLLVADQFEELYTLCPDLATRHRFLDTLFEALVGPSAGAAPLTLVLTLRADFMGHALSYRPFADALQDHNVVLGPMTKEELADAIVRPAQAQGRQLESGLADRLLADLGDQPGNLPLLEFALTQLWAQQQSGWLTHEAYDAIGHIEGALARYADGVYENLATADREAAERVFLQLVRPGEGTEDTRRVATHEELAEPDWELVRRLADARLVVTDRDATGVETAEVVHEALIRSWGRLRGWMDANRTFRTWQERLRFALRQWELSGHDEGTLLRGAPLAEAEGWLQQRKDALSLAERAFIAGGAELRDREAAEREAARTHELELERQKAEAQAQRAEAEALRAEEQVQAAGKLRQRAVLLAGAMVVAAALAIVAVVSRQQAIHDASIARARELAAAATSSLTVDPERSALLALAAISTTQRAEGSILPEAATALHQAVSGIHTVHALRHDDLVVDIAYSPDGARIATSSSDKSAKLWNAATGQLLHKLVGHTDGLSKLAFSPDGKLLATASQDKTARLWDVSTGKQLHVLIGHQHTLNQIAFSPDGKFLVSASQDKTARVWDVQAGKELLTLSGHQSSVLGAAISPDGRLIATWSTDKTLRVWDAKTGKQVYLLGERPSEVASLAFSPDGRSLAESPRDRTLFSTVWSVENGQERFRLEGHKSGVTAIAYSPDGRRLATGSSDNTARIWDAANGRELLTLADHRQRVRSVAWSPRGDRLATTSTDGTVKVWDTVSGRLLSTLLGHGGAVWKVVFAPDGLHVASTANETAARVWELGPDHELAAVTGPALAGNMALNADGTRLAILWDANDVHSAQVIDAVTGRHIATLSGHEDRLWQVDFSPDGKRVATNSLDKTAKVWDAETGAELLTLAGHAVDLNGVEYSQDGKRIATVGGDKTARIWDAMTGRELLKFADYTASGYEPHFNRDGTRLVTKGNSPKGYGVEAVVWDLATGKRAFKLPEAAKTNVVRAKFSPNGKLLVTAGSEESGFVRIWDAETGALLKDLPLGATRGESDIAFTPDGAMLASEGQDGTVTVWKVASWQLLRRLEHHGSGAYVVWSPDAKSLVAVNTDGAIKVWDFATGAERFSLLNRYSRPPLVSADSKRLISRGLDNTVRIDLLQMPDLIAMARARLTRSLTEDECRQFLHVESCPPAP